MTTQMNPTSKTQYVIPPQTRMGHVHYITPNLERLTAFYQDILGFKVHWRDGDSAGLGAGGEDLLRLTENPNAKRTRRTTGLYHTAFLVPTLLEQAQLLKSIAVTRTPIQGMTNHGTHYAIYLPDPDNNGIELAWDQPQEEWPRTLDEMMSRHRGLEPEQVFAAFAEHGEVEWEGLHRDTKIGHVHLHVSQLQPTRAFYHEVLGFEYPLGFENARGGFADSAVFFAAGGYHHHIGTNVWQGVGAPPPPPDAIGLKYYTVVLPNAESLSQVIGRVEAAGYATAQTENGTLVRDPAQNGVLLTSAG